MVVGPSLEEFKPDLAIDKWLNSTCHGKGGISMDTRCVQRLSVVTDDVYQFLQLLSLTKSYLCKKWGKQIC